MRTPLLYPAIGVIVLSSGGSMAGDVSHLRLASLLDTLATPAVHYFSPKERTRGPIVFHYLHGTIRPSCFGQRN